MDFNLQPIEPVRVQRRECRPGCLCILCVRYPRPVKASHAKKSLRLPTELWAEIEAAKVRTGLSASAIGREAFVLWLDRNGRHGDR